MRSVSDMRHRLGWMTVSFGPGRLLGPAVAVRSSAASADVLFPSLLAAGLLLVAQAVWLGFTDE